MLLHRKFRDWEWYGDWGCMVVFQHLLLGASWENNTWRGHKIMRGQLVTGRKKLAAELRTSEQSIRTILSKLSSTKEITIESTNKYSVITICKYDDYQIPLEQINQQITIQSTDKLDNKSTSESTNELTTTKEDKKIRKQKQYIGVCERRYRLLCIFYDNPSTPRDKSEDYVWDDIKHRVTDDEIELLTKFYQESKSDEIDETFQRKLSPNALFRDYSSQLDIARAYFSKKNNSGGDGVFDSHGIPEAGHEIT